MSGRKQRQDTRPEEVFIDEEHDIYKNNLLKNVNAQFKGSEKDVEILFKMFQQIVKPKLKNFTVQEAFNSVFDLSNATGERMRGVEACRIKFDKGYDGIDTASMEFSVKKKVHYLMIPYMGYYQNPNQVHIAYFLRKYPKKGGGIFKPFQSCQLGYKWNYDKNQSFYYFLQEFKPFYHNRIRTQFQEVFSASRVIESNVTENLNKTSLIFQMDLFPENRPKLFTHSFIDDPDNYVYLKLIQKRRRNKVDTDHCSRTLMERAINHDKLFSAKAGLKLGQVCHNHDRFNQHNSLFQVSTEIASNFKDVKYLKSKFFLRNMLSYHNVTVQSSLSGGAIKDLSQSGDHSQIKVNDNFYLRNFKGVRNLGYYYDQNNPVKGISGENLGFNKFLNLNLKFYKQETPLLRNFDIDPFIHTNIALAPNRNIVNDGQPFTFGKFLSDYARASLGFGASLQLEPFAIEFYYNPLVYRQKNEIKSEFQINIGID